jgi:hypothetical protein
MAAHGHDSTVLEQSPTLSCQENQGYHVHLYSTDLFFALIEPYLLLYLFGR